MTRAAGFDPNGGRSSRRVDSAGAAGFDPNGGRSSRRVDSAGAVAALAALGMGAALAGCPIRRPPVESPVIRLDRIERVDDQLRLHLAIAGRDRRAVALDALDWEVGVSAAAAPRRGRTHLDGAVTAGARRVVTLTVDGAAAPAGRPVSYDVTLHGRGPDGPLASFLDDATRAP